MKRKKKEANKFDQEMHKLINLAKDIIVAVAIAQKGLEDGDFDRKDKRINNFTKQIQQDFKNITCFNADGRLEINYIGIKEEVTKRIL